MKTIGITGGIASGKSMVTDYLVEQGANLIDADYVSRQLVAPGQAALHEISRLFGEEYLDQEGNLRRKALAHLIFSDAQQRQKLDQLMHPLIHEAIQAQLVEYQQAGQQLVILVAPLLYEAGLSQLVDEVWLIAVHPDTQLRRLMNRDELTLTEANKRLAAQSSLAEKLDKADVIINNNGDIKTTLAQIKALWRVANEEKK
jgi:dephospho-CoA kinase